jgi:hypothetical protein
MIKIKLKELNSRRLHCTGHVHHSGNSPSTLTLNGITPPIPMKNSPFLSNFIPPSRRTLSLAHHVIHHPAKPNWLLVQRKTNAHSKSCVTRIRMCNPCCRQLLVTKSAQNRPIFSRFYLQYQKKKILRHPDLNLGPPSYNVSSARCPRFCGSL